MLVDEGFPHAGLEGCGCNDEDSLAVSFGDAADHLGGHVGLPEPDFVGDDHSVVFVEESQHACDAFTLVAEEIEERLVELFGGFAIELPQHPQEHDPR